MIKPLKMRLSCLLSIILACAVRATVVVADDNPEAKKDWMTLGQFLASFVDRSGNGGDSLKVDESHNLTPEPPLVSIDPLPNCTRSQVRLEEVFDHSSESERLDMLFYNYADSVQSRRSDSWRGNITGYDERLYTQTDTGRPDFWQGFARLIKLSCLPTRFRFTYVGSRRYREFREGERAWDE